MASGFGLAAPTTSNRLTADLTRVDQVLSGLLEPGDYDRACFWCKLSPTNASSSWASNGNSSTYGTAAHHPAVDRHQENKVCCNKADNAR